jgi:hypothetical protein
MGLIAKPESPVWITARATEIVALKGIQDTCIGFGFTIEAAPAVSGKKFGCESVARCAKQPAGPTEADFASSLKRLTFPAKDCAAGG